MSAAGAAAAGDVVGTTTTTTTVVAAVAAVVSVSAAPRSYGYPRRVRCTVAARASVPTIPATATSTTDDVDCCCPRARYYAAR